MTGGVGPRKTVEAAGGQIVTDVDKKSFSDALVPLYPTARRGCPAARAW